MLWEILQACPSSANRVRLQKSQKVDQCRRIETARPICCTMGRKRLEISLAPLCGTLCHHCLSGLHHDHATYTEVIFGSHDIWHVIFYLGIWSVIRALIWSITPLNLYTTLGVSDELLWIVTFNSLPIPLFSCRI